MKGFLKMFRTAFVFCIVMMLLCSFAYPLALTGASQAVMKEKAGGSLIDREGNLTDNPEKAVGSVLLGQDFTEDYFFQGRVSAVHYNTYTEEQKESGEYGGVSSGSFNYGNSSPDLEARIKKDLDSFLASHPGVKAEDVPADSLDGVRIRPGSSHQPGGSQSTDSGGGRTLRTQRGGDFPDCGGEHRGKDSRRIRRRESQCIKM